MEGDHPKSKPESVMDLMEKLHKDIKGSDWLQQNTAEKWSNENPELAAEYMKALNKNSDKTDVESTTDNKADT